MGTFIVKLSNRTLLLVMWCGQFLCEVVSCWTQIGHTSLHHAPLLYVLFRICVYFC